MPLTSDTNRWEYDGDGVTPDFPYENLIFAATDLEVYFDEVLQVSGFAVSGVGVETGGNVTPTPVVADGVKIVIVAAIPFIQPQDFVDNEAVDAQAFEDGLNRMTRLTHRINDTIGRQATLPTAEPEGADMTVPALATRLGKYWGFDAIDGSLVAFGAPADTTAVSVFWAAVLTAADAAASQSLLDVAGQGYAVTESSPQAMTVEVAAGALFNSITRERVTNAAQTTATIIAPSINPRIDIVHIDRLTGVVGVTTGAEAASPVAPALDDGKVPLDEIALATSTTQITNSLLTDVRELNLLGAGRYIVKNPAVEVKSSAYTVVPTDDGKLFECDVSSSGFTLTLTAAATLGDGFLFGVKITGHATNAVTIDPDDAEQIEGVTTRAVSGEGAVEWFRCDGAKFLLTADAALIGRVVQVVNTLTGAHVTGTTIIPEDDTKPQNDEGDEYMTRTITPENTSNILKIDVVFSGSIGAARIIIVALFQDAIVNALAAFGYRVENTISGTSFTYYMIAGTESTITFKVRAGPTTASTMGFNGISASALMGGVMASSITITEIAA